MLDWLHSANDWMGSILLFIFLCVICVGIVFVVIDETLDLIFGAGKDDDKPSQQEGQDL